MFEFKNYNQEANEKWGKTDAFKEYNEKTKDYEKEKWNNLSEEMNNIFSQFSECIKIGDTPDALKPQKLVKDLQNHITENYYHCTNEILSGLGQIYIADERFKNNIDKNGNGTAEFISKAIENYCKN